MSEYAANEQPGNHRMRGLVLNLPLRAPRHHTGSVVEFQIVWIAENLKCCAGEQAISYKIAGFPVPYPGWICRNPDTGRSPHLHRVQHSAVTQCRRWLTPTLCPSLPRSWPFPTRSCRRPRAHPRGDRGAGSVSPESLKRNILLKMIAFRINDIQNLTTPSREGSGDI